MNVIIVDDDRLVVSSLNTILETDPEIRVVGSGYSGAEALHLCQRLCPDLLLIDIRMDGLSGIEAAKRLMNQNPKAKVLFLTTFSDDEYIIEALRIGAKGYILKQNFESIIPAIKAVFSGQRVFGDAIIDKIPSLMKSNEQPNFSDYHFSSRELAMIKLVANGKSNREIAQELYLSEGTVRNYISSILEKLALRDRTQLAVFYYKQS
ncbi:response regulator [Sporolactobacillus inulinus]|uniref:LuxR family transcriptional regulator n=1 Tax=Sporolactobacillus inulinus CASD TaxID=1069536 RepID=A0A0U1QT10_9BACL|nr:response regulator transcription factor [Sporolactobacillus inulinus]KLI03935.1 LuxR family transcriptional regulator [Sporolactobacillus inulinus CASD]GEB76948.1 DNA-binding response regulator [Sporolactobacillus inulinus]